MNRIQSRARLVLALSVIAGGCVPLLAQNADNAQAQPKSKHNAPESMKNANSPDLRSCDWLSDRPVVNENAEDVANTSDFILDRGSGRIQFAILKTGAILGMGGKSVVLPYSALRWDVANQRYMLTTTREQLKTLPEFSPETWTAVMEPGANNAEPGDLSKRLTEHGAAAQDPYVDSLNAAKPVRIQGEILSVERVNADRGGEQVEIVVKTKEGQRRVALGPAWYVNGSASAPMRGDTVTIDALTVARGQQDMVVATNFGRDSNQMRLRESDGSPAWGLRSLKSDGKEYSSPRWRYILLSDVKGAKIQCRAEECGKVADIILDRRSGQAAFVSIDPNENFLGIADTKRLAPWSIATISLGGEVRLDATKQMILASPQIPDEFNALNSGEASDMVYRAYQTKAPSFEPPHNTDAAAAISGNDPWRAKGPICSSIDASSKRSITGTIESMKRETFANGVPAATVYTIKSGDETYPIVLGPSWYMDNQRLTCRDGDTVTVEAFKGQIDGKQQWIASSLECKGARVVLLDGGRDPAWDRR